MSIRPMSVRSTFPLAEVMADQGYRVKPKANTLLDDATKASLFPIGDVNIDLDGLATDMCNITTFPVRSNKVPQAEGESEYLSLEEMIDENVKTIHSSLLDDNIPFLTQSIRKHLHFARNVVKPIITKLHENLVADTEKLVKNDPSQLFNIVSLKLPEHVNDVSYMSQFDQYENKNYGLESNEFLPLDNLTDEEFGKLALTEYDEINDSLKKALTQLPSNFLTDLRDVLFSSAPSQLNTLGNYVSKLNVYQKFYLGQLIYNIGYNLYNNPPENYTQMNYSALKEKARDIMNYGGSLLYSSYNLIQSYISSGILVLGTEPEKKTITVSGEVYDNWLRDTTNSPEHLFGVLVSYELPNSNELASKKDFYLKQYKDYCVYNAAIQSNRLLDAVKTLLVEDFYLDLTSTQSDMEKEYELSNVDYKVIIKNNLNALVESLTMADLDDLYLICLKAIGQCRFYYTSAFSILFDMYTTMKSNPDLDPMEAALLASINYIGEYLAYMIKKEN